MGSENEIGRWRRYNVKRVVITLAVGALAYYMGFRDGEKSGVPEGIRQSANMARRVSSSMREPVGEESGKYKERVKYLIAQSFEEFGKTLDEIIIKSEGER